MIRQAARGALVGVSMALGLGAGIALAATLSTFQTGQPISAGAMNANFAAISAELAELRAQVVSRPVAALYMGLEPQIDAGTNQVSFKKRVVDTGAIPYYSGGTFTVPNAGLYNISASVSVQGSFESDSKTVLYVFVNGSYAVGNSMLTGAVVPFSNPVVSINAYPLKVGDRVSVYVYCDAANKRFGDEDGNNYFSIQRVSSE